MSHNRKWRKPDRMIWRHKTAAFLKMFTFNCNRFGCYAMLSSKATQYPNIIVVVMPLVRFTCCFLPFGPFSSSATSNYYGNRRYSEVVIGVGYSNICECNVYFSGGINERCNNSDARHLHSIVCCNHFSLAFSLSISNSHFRYFRSLCLKF